MKIKDYNKSNFANYTVEPNGDHRERVQEIYQHNFCGNWINGRGFGRKVSGGIVEYDRFVEQIEENLNDKYIKFFTLSYEFDVTKERIEAIKKGIEHGKIFVNAYGNTNTKVFNDGDEDVFIKFVGVEKNKDGSYAFRSYVSKDLTQIDTTTFAVDRMADGMPQLGYSGTSFDQPYGTQLMDKITTYIDDNYNMDINKGKLVELMKQIGKEITIKGKTLWLISNEIDFRKVDELMDNQITIQIDTKKAKFFGEEKQVELIIKDDRTYMPLREILEALGHKVDWDNDTRTIIITK